MGIGSSSLYVPPMVTRNTCPTASMSCAPSTTSVAWLVLKTMLPLAPVASPGFSPKMARMRISCWPTDVSGICWSDLMTTFW